MNTYEAIARAQKAGDLVGAINQLDPELRFDTVDLIVNKRLPDHAWVTLDTLANIRTPRKQGFISSPTTREQVRSLLIANGFKPQRRGLRFFRR